MKSAIIHRAVRDAIRGFPDDVRRSLGKAIWDLQREMRLGMPLSRPMPSVGRGVEEIRVKDRSGAYRVFYLARASVGIVVFHAFHKTSQQTPQKEIEIARKRLRELLDENT